MNARAVLLVIGAVLLVAGVIGLLVPVSASSNNEGVGCGIPIAGGDLAQAQDKDKNLGNTAADAASSVGLPGISNAIPQTHFVAACNSAVSTRLWWSIPLAIIGLLGIGGSFLAHGRAPTP